MPCWIFPSGYGGHEAAAQPGSSGRTVPAHRNGYFAPIAREKNLKFKVLPTSLYVRTDANLLSATGAEPCLNAIKYTISGKVLVGARRRGKDVVIEVLDSGIGIPSSKFKSVFKEFTRLDEGARTAAGLGLGLSIVDRISRVLAHPVELTSTPGRGTIFRVRLPRVRKCSLPCITGRKQPCKSAAPVRPARAVHR